MPDKPSTHQIAMQQRIEQSHAWVRARCDAVKHAVLEVFEALCTSVDADGISDKHAAELAERALVLVQQSRVLAHEQAAADAAAELAQGFPAAKGLELPSGDKPQLKQVTELVRSACAIACTLTNDAAADCADATEVSEVFSAQSWRVERVAITETVKAYASARMAAYEALAKRDTSELGFAVCDDEEQLEARAAEPVITLLGLRWSALFDKRTCEKCKQLDGAMTIVALPFNGPPAHTNCRCVTSLWPLVWNWVEEIAS